MKIYTIQDRTNTFRLRDYDDRKGCLLANDTAHALKFESRVLAAQWMAENMPDVAANNWLIVAEEYNEN
nr:MAG TPA: hypothetical protein [Caudoviricetes sp.]